MVNRANGTRANGHRAYVNRANVVAPKKIYIKCVIFTVEGEKVN